MTLSVLVTGFGPFPSVAANPTEAIIQRLQQRPANGSWNLHAHVLPTEYESASMRIEALIRAIQPNVCICFGVAGPGSIRLERLARNEGTSSTPDNAGSVHLGVIEPQGPPLYHSTLPLNAIGDALFRAGFAVEVSDDAGGYVCNHIFFVACHATHTIVPSTVCGFVHVPPVAPETISIDQLVNVAEIIIDAAAHEAIRAMM